jgi:hypothetical protein
MHWIPLRAQPKAARKMRLRFSSALAASWVLATAMPIGIAQAYGTAGHLIVGRVAASFLCQQAALEVGRLSREDGLDEIGLWADRIRNVPRYSASAPWHYMNIPDTGTIERYTSPPEGDVLSALERYHALLARPSSATADRLEALRFLVHFLVDLHQPLHVGRAEDRGGNQINIVVNGATINLHRLWDTESITLRGLSVPAYAREISQSVTDAMLAAPFAPRAWAREAMELRADVYAFSGSVPSAAYLERMQVITRQRLILAAARLAGTLNSLYCH